MGLTLGYLCIDSFKLKWYTSMFILSSYGIIMIILIFFLLEPHPASVELAINTSVMQ